MARGYSRLKDAPDADDDSVALMLGQAPPRLSRFGATEYVQLDNLDPEGNPTDADNGELTREQQTHETFLKSRQRSRNLVSYIVGGAIVLVVIAMVVTTFNRRHARTTKSLRDQLVLVNPLDPHTMTSNGTHEFHRTTLVLSLDGMHPHYISEVRTPNLHYLANNGFATPYMRPAFPTQTFPNHWTLITGNYPVNHGIIGNTFFDPELGLEFVNTDPEKSRNRQFWGGEPLWITAAQHGVRSAVHMWPGSEADWGNQYPDENSPFDGQESLDSKVAHIAEWLDRGPDEMPQLMLAYVPNIDTAGHANGISGPSMFTELHAVDKFVGDVVEVIAKRNLTDIVNLVVLSDHGMGPVLNDHIVLLDEVVDNYANVTSDLGWPLAGLRFTEKSGEENNAEVDKAVASVERVIKKEHQKGIRVFHSDATPESWRFSTSDVLTRDGRSKMPGKYAHRLAPMYIVPDPTWAITTREEWDGMGHDYFLKGVHGYDNAEPLMRAMFLAQGPAFPSGDYRPFDSVDVYSALCRSLGFREAITSDGNFTGIPLTHKLPMENYPGVSGIAYFSDSSFADLYEH